MTTAIIRITTHQKPAIIIKMMTIENSLPVTPELGSFIIN